MPARAKAFCSFSPGRRPLSVGVYVLATALGDAFEEVLADFFSGRFFDVFSALFFWGLLCEFFTPIFLYRRFRSV